MDPPLPPPAGRAQNGSLSPLGRKISFAWPYLYPHPAGIDSRLAVVGRDGTSLQEYPDLKNPDKMCWSPDESQLVVYTEARAGDLFNGVLYLLNLSSGKIQELGKGPVLLTPQCWSPDEKAIAYAVPANRTDYSTGSRMAVYDFAEGKSRDLGPGALVTWSPDGNRIAYYDHESYWLLTLRTDEPTQLFAAPRASTGLLWSPDSLFVAYAICCRYPLLEGANARVYVRRLSDNAQDFVGEVGHLLDDRNLNWIRPPKR